LSASLPLAMTLWRAGACLDAEELIAIVVDFFADFLARLDRHQDQLEIVTGVEDLAEEVVLLGQLLDVVDESLHD
jgi:hypothetical protein